MKIVHVCLCGDVFNEHYAYQDNILPKYHHKLGHEVYIIAPTYSEYRKQDGKILSESAGEKVIGDGIKLIRLKPSLPLVLNKHIHVFDNFLKTIGAINPDLLFVHGVISINYRSLKKYKVRHPHVRIVYDNHADSNNSGRSKLTYLYSKYIVKRLVVDKIKETSDFFYGVTPARCDYLHEMYGVPQHKIHLLPMGADDEEMRIKQKETIRKGIRAKYGIEKDDFLIVAGGKIDPIKNIHVLAEAVSQVEYRKIKMLVFGSIRNDLQETFHRLESERIQCVGWIPSNEVYKYFYAADIVMFPGLHSVLWEQAVASQVPCAFRKIDGFNHVDIGGNCIFFEENSSDYYRSMIEKVYLDKALYEQLRVNAQKPEANQFLYSEIAKRVISDVR